MELSCEGAEGEDRDHKMERRRKVLSCFILYKMI